MLYDRFLKNNRSVALSIDISQIAIYRESNIESMRFTWQSLGVLMALNEYEINDI